MKLFIPFLVAVMALGAPVPDQQPIPAKPTQTLQKDSPIFDPDISTFASTVKAAGLWDLFIDTGPFTAYAPNNAAFEKLGQKKLNELLQPQNRDRLVAFITYHIVPGEYLSSNTRTSDIRTVNGKMLHLQNNDGQVTVNGSRVIRSDMKGPNGVLHIIDAALLP